MYVLYKLRKDRGIIYLKVLLICPNGCIALLVALKYCIENFMVESIQMPKTLVSSTGDRCAYVIFQSINKYLRSTVNLIRNIININNNNNNVPNTDFCRTPLTALYHSDNFPIRLNLLTSDHLVLVVNTINNQFVKEVMLRCGIKCLLKIQKLATHCQLQQY